ncbi:MAG: hypothetical protein WCF18_20125 [Chthoniobacteraceae bacterium]
MVKHPVILRGYHAAANDKIAQPLLVKRTDQEFVPGVLDGLRRKLTPEQLGKPAAAEDFLGGNLRLYQPVHRTFNLVLLEAVCERPGFPRLDPRDIVSAGFVVRRVNGAEEQGWLLRDDHVIGWNAPVDAKLDPDPRQRRPRLNAGNPHINGKLARLHEALEPPAERVAPLFLAPPDVCTEAGRTLIYGLVPVSSSERSEEPAPVEVDPEIVTASTPPFLRDLNYDVRSKLGSEIAITGLENRFAANPPDPLVDFIQDLRLIHFGWRAFDSPEGALIATLLHEIKLQFGDAQRPLDDYLRELVNRLVLRTDGRTDPIPVPDVWPAPDATLAGKIRAAAQNSLQARLREGVPNEQRFAERNALYRIHAFIRVRCADGCPPVLQWSSPSAVFSIAPWWANGAKPLHTIELPDFDKDTIKNIKPNVAFKLPPRLAEMLKQSPKTFLDGKATLPGIGLGWVCSLSIPIITLCAFIVLFIFLVLLHIAFQWLFYIKICLPFPKPESAPPPP